MKTQSQVVTAHTDQYSHSEDNPEDMPSREPRLWSGDGWTARVIKNDDDEGWAVAMIKDGEPEPALIGPWTMGRDKKNPKPLNTAAFSVLVKTASEFVRRHEQQLHATLHKSIDISKADGAVTVTLDIQPDDDNPSAVLSARDGEGALLASFSVSPAFKLNHSSASKWIDAGYMRPLAN